MNQDIDNQIGGYESESAVAVGLSRGQHVPAVGGGISAGYCVAGMATTPDKESTAASQAGRHPEQGLGGDGLTSLKRIDVSHQCSPASPIHAELARLRDRLECDYIYNHRGEPVPWEDGMPDAIDCRDATIRLLRDDLARVKAECERYREALGYIAVYDCNWCYETGEIMYEIAQQALQEQSK